MMDFLSNYLGKQNILRYEVYLKSRDKSSILKKGEYFYTIVLGE